MGLFGVPEGFPLDYVNELANKRDQRKEIGKMHSSCYLPTYLPSSHAVQKIYSNHGTVRGCKSTVNGEKML